MKMAEIICPMCGKPNPETVETCRFCQARLKPLHIDQNADQNGGTPDWLAALLGSQPEAAPSPQAPMDEPRSIINPPIEEAPLSSPVDETAENEDWLARIRQRTQEEGDAISRFGPEPVVPPEEERQAALAGEDWLKDLQGFSADQPESTPEPPAEPAQEDWLNRLRDQQSTEPEQFPQPAHETPAAEPEQPVDWTAVLRQAAEQAPAEPEPEPTQAIPDWMSAFQPPVEETPTVEPSKATSDVPDWMTPFRDQAQIEQPSEELKVEPAAEMPDWMSSFQPSLEETTPSASEKAPEVPDWMASVRETGEEIPPANNQPETSESTTLKESVAGTPPEPAIEPIEPSPAAEETLDWMNAFIEAAPEETTTEITPQTNAEAPEWLKSYSEKLMGTVEPNPDAAVPAEETPEWLRSLAAASEVGLPGEETPQQSVPEQPDWLKSFEPAPEVPEKPGGETPDWLKEYEKDSTTEEQQPAEQTAAFSAETPDWLKAYAEESSIEHIPPPQATRPLDFVAGSSLPSGEPEKTAPFEGEVSIPAAPTQPFETSELPDWLSAEADQISGASENNAENIERIEPAQLPAWLQAMRPVEAVPLDAGVPIDDQHVEKAGPLAGLRGVLVGENSAAEYQKPPTFSTKLLVTDRQRLQANLLEEMLANENRPAEIHSERVQSPQLIGRLVTAVVLLCAILAALLIPFTNALPSDMSSPQTPAYRFFQIVNSLPENAPVLVAVDYDAGLSGELSKTSVGVIQNLMMLKARLTLVSTSTSGTILGEELLQDAAVGIPNYSVSASTVNLGYLPSGANSLQELASSPLYSVIGVPQRSNGDWSDPTLAGVQQISDFDLVVVLVDNADTARYWIEQVQPALGDTKLVMVISAQSAAIIQPYEGKQVAAMLSGLPGGMAYSAIAGFTGAPTRYWTAYQIGVAVIIVFILLGVILQGVLDVTNRQKSKNKA